MIGIQAASSQSAADTPSFKLRIGTDAHTLGLEEALQLAHALLKARRYDFAVRICEVVLHCDANISQAAILLACCKAGLQEYAICNRILQAVCDGDDGHLAEQVETALLSNGSKQGVQFGGGAL